MKHLKYGISALLAAALMLPGWASADDWEFGKKLSFDTTNTGVEIEQDVSALPVLVRLHSGNFKFAEAKPDGSDLRFFAADNKTPLAFHIESFDATNELAVVWVKLPKLKAKAKTDTLMVRWGNKGAAAAGESKSVYDESQVMVLNFSEADGVKDATGNANHARESSGVAVAAGPIGAAMGFNGAARVVVPASASLVLKPATGWTMTAWVKPDSLTKGSLLTVGLLSVDLVAGAPTVKFGNASAAATQKLQAGTWQHLAVVYAGGKAQFFVDGNAAGEAALNMNDASGDVVLGSGLSGELDAVTLANVPRTPAYIKAFASSQVADSLMLGFAEAEEGAAEVAYFSILIGAVTIDGWVVIGLLGVMLILSIWVMYTKTMMLSRYEKANAAFLAYYKEHAVRMLQPGSAEGAALKDMASVQNSPLLEAFEIGMQEIVVRFKMQDEKSKAHGLTGAAVDSIRATLDALMLRVNQRLNSGIVTLTIAISGGPFLGLLGTVVGVMITFAAIAAAGDVNVNAIAPGIAAALVATVAGLAVAIPALFAYNWFAIKIKNISSDLAVFADEFLTRSAELHNDQ
jgi:biopolymer transport protein ExbB